MGNINDRFDFLGLSDYSYKHKDKIKNVNNLVAYMMNRSNIMFKYHGLPETIPESALEKLIQTNGFCAIGKINDELYAVNAGLGGIPDVYNNPTKAAISVPYLNYNSTWVINADCVVVKNDLNGVGLLPLYYKYCTLINENEITMLLSNVNKRVQSLLSANDESTISSAKEFLKRLYDGELGVVAESKVFDSLKVNQTANVSNNIADLIEYEQYLKASLYNEIGLNANWNMKRERLTSNEVELNSDNLYPLVDNMLQCRRDGIKKVNELFETNIEVELNSSWDYRIYNGKSIHDTDEEVNAEFENDIPRETPDEDEEVDADEEVNAEFENDIPRETPDEDEEK